MCSLKIEVKFTYFQFDYELQSRQQISKNSYDNNNLNIYQGSATEIPVGNQEIVYYTV